MKPTTQNKIAFCQYCHGVLTQYQDNFCNEVCEKTKKQFEAERPGVARKLWVYLNKNMLDLTQSQKVEPYQFSYFFYSGHELVGVAQFDTDELEGIGDHETNVYDAWWREIGRLNTSIEPHRPQTMRKDGILSYLCDEHGISTEKNVACAIGELTAYEGHENPLQLINSL